MSVVQKASASLMIGYWSKIYLVFHHKFLRMTKFSKKGRNGKDMLSLFYIVDSFFF
jgi:hypothetical protein